MIGTTPLFGFDSRFLRKLEQIALATRRPVVGPSTGRRRSARHGSSAEFADFREYAPGDDVRRVDWNAYARLDRLFLRLFAAEEVATLTLYLDHSRSMSFGEPSKGLTAARLAAVFSYVALFAHDHVAVAGWNDSVDRYLPPQSGTQSISRTWRFIDELMRRPEGLTDFAALGPRGPLRRRGSLAVVLSDFLTTSDWRSGLLALQASGQEVVAVQILSPDELDPSIHGDWQLRDVETGATVDVTGSSRLLRGYKQSLDEHLTGLRTFCRSHRVAYVQVTSDESLEDTVLGRVRLAGIVS